MCSDTSLTVAVIDDDQAMREAMMAVLDSVGIPTEGFNSAQSLLTDERLGQFRCLVMDIRMPGLSGMQAQIKLQEMGMHLPIIFVTGHGDIEMAVDAMKRGASDFITKPFRDQVLIDAVQSAIQQPESAVEPAHSSQALSAEESAEGQAVMAKLTRREKQVLALVVEGKRSKQIADELCIAVKTVEEYRSRLLDKMNVRSSTELVSLATRLNLRSPGVSK